MTKLGIQNHAKRPLRTHSIMPGLRKRAMPARAKIGIKTKPMTPLNTEATSAMQANANTSARHVFAKTSTARTAAGGRQHSALAASSLVFSSSIVLLSLQALMVRQLHDAHNTAAEAYCVLYQIPTLRVPAPTQQRKAAQANTSDIFCKIKIVILQQIYYTTINQTTFQALARYLLIGARRCDGRGARKER